MAKDGDTVTVHYRGTLDNGEEFDSSRGGDPFTFVVGKGQVIPGFEDTIRGLATGQSAKVRLEPDKAYGQRSVDMVFEVPLDQAPQGLKAGDRVRLGNGAPALIAEITDQVVRVDANHPLAGQALTFEIELVSIQ